MAKSAPILSPSMVLLLFAMIGSLVSFNLLLSAVPLYVASGVGAGSCTGAMMLATVLIELVVPFLLARLGYRSTLALGLLLIGLPAAVLVTSSALPLVLCVCLARGAGLGIVVVAGTALAAELVPPQRRAEGMALYGVAVGAPAIVGLPLGVWLSDRIGFDPVFLAAAVLSLVGLIALPGLPSQRCAERQHGGVLRGLREGRIARPTLIFAAVTMVAGVVMTFLPLAVPAGARGVAAVALFVQTCATPIARWCAGRFGTADLLVPAVFTGALGTACLVWLDNPFAVVAGAALFGIGFGISQNVTLTRMLDRVPQSEFGRVSALWNLAFDGGMGLGAVGFGLVAAGTGYSIGFAVLAVVLALALVPARRDLTEECDQVR